MSSDPLRSKFFQKIGIDAACVVSQKGSYSRSDAVSVSSFEHPAPTTSNFESGSLLPYPRDLKNVPRYTEPLKYNHRDERMREERGRHQQKSLAIATKTSVDATSSNSTKKIKRITFSENVNVVPIPMRSEYSDRIRTRLWSDAVEIYENAGQSTIRILFSMIFLYE